MKKLLKALAISGAVGALYVGSYAIWRGPAKLDQCDHPYQVYLPNNVLTSFYWPAIVVDAYMNDFSNEIHIASPYS